MNVTQFRSVLTAELKSIDQILRYIEFAPRAFTRLKRHYINSKLGAYIDRSFAEEGHVTDVRASVVHIKGTQAELILTAPHYTCHIPFTARVDKVFRYYIPETFTTGEMETAYARLLEERSNRTKCYFSASRYLQYIEEVDKAIERLHHIPDNMRPDITIKHKY